MTAALNGETILGGQDPALHLAYPLGTSDGRDKVLSLWTREDWRNASMTRYRNAAEVTAAAQIFEEQATIIADRMLSAGAGTTGELLWWKGGAGLVGRRRERLRRLVSSRGFAGGRWCIVKRRHDRS